MNEVLNRISQSNLTSFFKDESSNKLMRHKKIYNLKLDYLTKYRPSLKSLRQNPNSNKHQKKVNKSIFTIDDIEDPMKTFIIHKQATSLNCMEKKVLIAKSPKKFEHNSFRFFEVSCNERKKMKYEQNFEKFGNFRVFSKNSLISPKFAYAESPRVFKNTVKRLKQENKIKSCKHEPLLKKIEDRPLRRILPLVISPIKVNVRLKNISDGTIRGWDKFPSMENFVFSPEEKNFNN